ncbi:hypothetical protein FGO68_gene15353 [Halteria grandinella]|uniref:Uncharacterized protein n=1 Tax=Halteria grandinella TaxID=5974 RepID=A0A8J8SU92_HALGN|nr:hypothetical protein FGO68_gene15353 [Halteria grandinella]
MNSLFLPFQQEQLLLDNFINYIKGRIWKNLIRKLQYLKLILTSIIIQEQNYMSDLQHPSPSDQQQEERKSDTSSSCPSQRADQDIGDISHEDDLDMNDQHSPEDKQDSDEGRQDPDEGDIAAIERELETDSVQRSLRQRRTAKDSSSSIIR